MNSSKYSLIDSDKFSYGNLLFKQWKDPNGNETIGDKTIEGDSFTFSGTVQIAVANPNDASKANTQNISITIPTVNLAKTE